MFPQTRLKQTKRFGAIYQRGRWVRGMSLSLGVLASASRETQVGLRTRRGLKGAVERNRLKRQLRVLLRSSRISLRQGIDVVIVIHPPALPAGTRQLAAELEALCKRAGILSQSA